MASHLYVAPERRAQPRVVNSPRVVVLGLACVLGFVILVLVARFMSGVAVDLHRVSETLGALPEMNRKLDRLASVSTTLQGMRLELHATVALLKATNGKLDVTNTKLDATNGKLDATNVKLSTTAGSIGAMRTSLQGMQAHLGALDAMKSDIHAMTHKVSGSFLFRGVR